MARDLLGQCERSILWENAEMLSARKARNVYGYNTGCLPSTQPPLAVLYISKRLLRYAYQRDDSNDYRHIEERCTAKLPDTPDSEHAGQLIYI